MYFLVPYECTFAMLSVVSESRFNSVDENLICKADSFH